MKIYITNFILELRAKNFYSYVYSINYGWKILEGNYVQKPNVNTVKSQVDACLA